MFKKKKRVVCVHFVLFTLRGQSFKESSLNSNQNVSCKDENMQDELQGEITESIGNLYEIPEPTEIMTIRKKQARISGIFSP